MNERTFQPGDAHKLEDPERRKWLPPDELVRRLDLQPGMDVADIGAGTGYFALPIAEALRGGTVYAVDLQTVMLERLRARLDTTAAAKALRLVQGDAAASNLPDRCVDRVLMANLWHELDDHPQALREVARPCGPAAASSSWTGTPITPRPPARRPTTAYRCRQRGRPSKTPAGEFWRLDPSGASIT